MNTIIIGLGNPGQEYEHTKHNIGYRIIKYLQKKNQFQEFETRKNSLISIKKDKKNKFVLVLPLTFMNKSGEAVKDIVKEYKISKKIKGNNQQDFLPVIVVHDDSDLPIGKIKISIGKNSGGHKGVESVMKTLKTKDFIRFRIGIQPPKGKHRKAEEIVLKKLSPDEEKMLGKVIKKSSEAIEAAVTENIDKARNILSA